MRLETNTTGNTNDATEADIRRSFENQEDADIADWAGNCHRLIAKDGTSLSAISGRDFRDFQLSRIDSDGSWWICNRQMTADDVIDRFIRYRRGERAWMTEDNWQEERQQCRTLAWLCRLLRLAGAN